MTKTPTIFVTQEHLDEGKRITDENAGRSIAHVLGAVDSALRGPAVDSTLRGLERELLRMPDDFVPPSKRAGAAEAFKQAIADAQDEPRHYVTHNAKMRPNGLQTACGAVRDWFDVSTDRRVVTCRHCCRVLDDAYQQAIADAQEERVAEAWRGWFAEEDFDMADDYEAQAAALDIFGQDWDMSGWDRGIDMADDHGDIE